MKEKLRKAVPYMIAMGAALCAGFILTAFLLRPRPLDIGTIELKTIADGEYIGVCQNKILFAVVKVRVQDHEIPIWIRQRE